MTGLENTIMEFTHSRLSSKRFEHVRRVVETLESIASPQGLDLSAARTTAWLHDSAKEEDKAAFRDLVDRGEIEIDEETLECPKLWHGYHAAYWGKARFGIDDEDLLAAVRHHPTGAPGLSEYGQALFVADYCEPGRGLTGTGEIVEIAKSDLNAAALRVVEAKIRYISEKGKTPHSRSIAYRDWLFGARAKR